MLPPLIVGLRGSVPTTAVGVSVPMGSCRAGCGLACSVLRSLRERQQPLETKPTSGGDGRRLALARLREVAQRVPSDHRGPGALAGVLAAANRGGRAPYQHKRALGKLEFATLGRGNYCVCATSPVQARGGRETVAVLDGWMEGTYTRKAAGLFCLIRCQELPNERDMDRFGQCLAGADLPPDELTQLMKQGEALSDEVAVRLALLD
jgi:hypothetical protein